jgi:hypothetical protein
MNDLTFDHLTRRASLTALGAAGVAGLLGHVPGTSAKESASKKAKKKAQQKCKSQVDQCIGSANVLCEDGDEECRGKVRACCPKLEDCNFTAFFACARASDN